jgi:hypothetical protein
VKPTDTRTIWRLVTPDPLAAFALVGAIGRVYAVVKLQEQLPTPPRSTGTGPPVFGEAEALLQEVLQLKIEGYRHRHFSSDQETYRL